MKKWILSVICVSLLLPAYAQLSLIPKPASVKENGAVFKLQANTRIYYEPGLKAQAELLAAALSPATGFDLDILPVSSVDSAGIFMKIDKKVSLNREAYHLSVNNSSIHITGVSSAGVFYGMQTVLQLFPPEVFGPTRKNEVDWRLKGVEITEEPQYVWRGMMLDVSRYFFSKAFVLKFIDLMAMHKLNSLHLHLVDDAGWRLEIKKYPKLTDIGAWRGKGAARNGGYYTQADIKEMVAYGAVRNVELIPEIELPAHVLSAIAAYPYLSCTGEQFEVQTQHSISKEIYCAGKESTFEFLSDVLKETAAMFPSRYLHIGGDEANYERWKSCPDCQRRKMELGLETEQQLQVYFNQRIQKVAATYGKTIVGWDEIIEEGLKEKVVGMIWNDPGKAFAALKSGHYTLMALTEYSYFDVPESSLPGEVKAATWLKPISLEKAYALDPMLPGIDPKYRNQVLGASAALWSDQFIHGTLLQEIAPLNENRSEKYMEYLALPRMAALAEVCWTPLSLRNWPDFECRMERQYSRYQQSGYGFRVPLPKLMKSEPGQSGVLLSLGNPVEGAEIRYTTNGLPPNVYSEICTGPVLLEKGAVLQAITVLNRNLYSLPLTFPGN